jgi:hypothetical protein
MRKKQSMKEIKKQKKKTTSKRTEHVISRCITVPIAFEVIEQPVYSYLLAIGSWTWRSTCSHLLERAPRELRW